VQQLYLKELQAYKVPQVKPSDAEGNVQKFAIPKAPSTPEEASLADGLKEYETTQPDIEGAAVEGQAVVEDWFVEEEEDEGHH
jgi:F-type H+-transporting ATPase subunit h